MFLTGDIVSGDCRRKNMKGQRSLQSVKAM